VPAEIPERFRAQQIKKWTNINRHAVKYVREHFGAKTNGASCALNTNIGLNFGIRKEKRGACIGGGRVPTTGRNVAEGGRCKFDSSKPKGGVGENQTQKSKAE